MAVINSIVSPTLSNYAPSPETLVRQFLALGAILIFFGGAFVFYAFFPRHPSVFRVGMVTWAGNDVLILAQENGYFKDTEVQFVTYPSSEEVLRAFQNKTIDAASVTGDEILRLIETRQDPRIFLVLDFSNGSDAIVARPSLSSLKGLKGRRIGVEPNAVGAYVLARALELAGLRQSDVIIVPELQVEHLRSYSEGSIDAAVVFEPVLSQLTAIGARPIFTSRDIPSEIFDALVARPETLHTHRRAIEALHAGWAKAARDINTSPRSSYERLAKYYQVDPEQVEKAMAGIVLPTPDIARALIAGRNSPIGKDLQRLGATLKQLGILKDEIDPTSAVAP